MTMARLVGRILLFIVTIAFPVWACAIVLPPDTLAREATPVVQAADEDSGPTEPASASMGAGESGEEDAAGVAELDDDDDASASGIVPGAGAPPVHPPPHHHSPAQSLACASPPHVHLEVQTPPPRA